MISRILMILGIVHGSMDLTAMIILGQPAGEHFPLKMRV